MIGLIVLRLDKASVLGCAIGLPVVQLDFSVWLCDRPTGSTVRFQCLAVR